MIAPSQVAMGQNQSVVSGGGSVNNKHYIVQKFAKSECPTPKSHEMEHRMVNN